jgi:hypothetical protein
MGGEEICRFQLYLLQEKHVSPDTVEMRVSARAQLESARAIHTARPPLGLLLSPGARECSWRAARQW